MLNGNCRSGQSAQKASRRRWHSNDLRMFVTKGQHLRVGDGIEGATPAVIMKFTAKLPTITLSRGNQPDS